MRLETLQTDQGWFKDKSRAIWQSRAIWLS